MIFNEIESESLRTEILHYVDPYECEPGSIVSDDLVVDIIDLCGAIRIGNKELYIVYVLILYFWSDIYWGDYKLVVGNHGTVFNIDIWGINENNGIYGL